MFQVFDLMQRHFAQFCEMFSTLVIHNFVIYVFFFV